MCGSGEHGRADEAAMRAFLRGLRTNGWRHGAPLDVEGEECASPIEVDGEMQMCGECIPCLDYIGDYWYDIAIEMESSAEALREAVNAACAIIELGDQRLRASDGPAGGQPPDLSLAEWRRLYVTLDNARRPHV